MDRLWQTDIPVWNLIVRAVVVYVAILMLLRISGKRQVGQMGIGQLVALLLISNAVQNSMNGGDNSLVAGLILAAVLIIVSYLIEFITYRSKKLENFVQGRPTLLVHKGNVLHDHLRRELLSVRELHVLLRKQGVHGFEEVEEAVLESDGFVSVVRKSEKQPVHAEPG
jgi:uncharacterized membrane protein YcaP (DUF421 family)